MSGRPPPSKSEFAWASFIAHVPAGADPEDPGVLALEVPAPVSGKLMSLTYRAQSTITNTTVEVRYNGSDVTPDLQLTTNSTVVVNLATPRKVVRNGAGALVLRFQFSNSTVQPVDIYVRADFVSAQ